MGPGGEERNEVCRRACARSSHKRQHLPTPRERGPQPHADRHTRGSFLSLPGPRCVSGPSARSADANRGSRRPLPQSVTNEQDRGSCWGGSPTTGQTVRTGRRRSHISKVVGGPFSLVPVCAGCTVGPRSAGRTFAARCVRDVPVAPCSKWSPGSPLGLSTYDAEHARRL